MRRHANHALPDQPTRVRPTTIEEVIRALFVDGAAAAAPGGGGSAAAAAGGGGDKGAAPAAGAAAGAAAAAPVGDKGGAPAAGKDGDKGAQPAAGKGDEFEPVIGKGEAKPAAGEPTKAPTVDEQRKFLTEKAGLKADEVAKLGEAELKTKYDEAVAAEAAKATKIDLTKLTAPEGIQLKPEAVKELADVLVDAKLTPQERAQKLIDAHGAALKEAVEANFNAWRDLQKTWQAEIKADKEIGGDKYNASRAAITNAVTQIMGKDADATFEAFKATGAGNNPLIVRLMARIGNLLAEGTHVSGDAPGAAKTKSFAQRVAAMYPSASGSQPAAGAAA